MCIHWYTGDGVIARRKGARAMETLIQAAADYYVITIIGGCVLAGMVLKSVTAIATNSARERSRREIAAYIAEGSMSAEQGERLMRAEVSGSKHVP
jgi:pseudouridine-5'-phosphate glycosidase